jgi:hypothetical protein
MMYHVLRVSTKILVRIYHRSEVLTRIINWLRLLIYHMSKMFDQIMVISGCYWFTMCQNCSPIHGNRIMMMIFYSLLLENFVNKITSA